MGEKTEIGWTDATFNPWWGCQRVSPGCEHCYAETFSKRYGHEIWGPTNGRRFFGDKHWAEPLRWDRISAMAARAYETTGGAFGGRRMRVFCASMADVFEQREDLIAPRDRLFRLIAATPNLDWLVLTKRPKEMRDYILEQRDARPGFQFLSWPLPNLWLGTTVENQAAADERIPLLLETPAAVRFLSCEPLLGAVDLSEFLGWECARCDAPYDDVSAEWMWPGGELKPSHRCYEESLAPNWSYGRRRLDWVITGGESGGPAERRLVEYKRYPRPGGSISPVEGWCLKPDALDWLRAIRDQCQAAGVSYFHKQNGGPTPKSGGRLLDGRTWDEFPEERG